jgi:hypothetical protein
MGAAQALGAGMSRRIAENPRGLAIQRLTVNPPLPEPLRQFLDRIRARQRRQRIAAACGWALALTIIWGILCCTVDRIAPLDGNLRLGLLLINAVGVLALLAPAFAALFERTANYAAIAIHAAQRDPALAEPMLTVVTRLLGPAMHRGSPDMLAQLSSDVAAEASSRDPARLLPARAVLRPWALSLVLAAIVAALSAIPFAGAGRLAARYFLPLREITPVSSASLIITPSGEIEIVEGDLLRVHAGGRGRGRDAPVLHLRSAETDEPWALRPMTPAPGGGFEFRLPDVHRDIEYFVSRGETSSERSVAHVLVRPAVVELRVRFDYPQYLALPAQDLGIADGRLEAPAGTHAAMEIRSSEALQAATVMVGAEAISTIASDNPRVRIASIEIDRDARFDIRLRSARGVEGVYRGGVIRAAADRAPVVRLEQPADGDVIAPGAPLAVTYQAADDNGIVSLVASVRRMAWAAAPRDFAIALAGDARQQRGTRRIDLSALNVRPGGSMRVQLRATDAAGQVSSAAAIVQVAAGNPTTPAPAPAPAPTPAPAPPAQPPAPAPAAPALDLNVNSAPVIEPAAYRDATDAYFRAIAGRRTPQ